MEATQGQTYKRGVPQAHRRSNSSDSGGTVFSRSGKNPLESEEAQKRLRELQTWRRQARIAQAENRIQMAIDEDYYDGIQLEPEELAVLLDRNQPPVVFNVIKNTVNWILGTERKSRIDYRILPRKKRGAESAKIKTKVIKYLNDVNKAEYVRSAAFTEAVKAGVSWLDIGVKKTGDEPIYFNHERWRNVWFDHLSTSIDGKDARFVFREKWVDLDVAQAIFPERADALLNLAEGVNSLYPYLPDDVSITDTASEFDLESDLDAMFGGPFDSIRQRLKLIEGWYRMLARVQLLRMVDDDTPFGTLHGVIYRPNNEDHRYLVKGGYFGLQDAVAMTVRTAIWAGSTLLQDMLSPYNHLEFPLIPIWCYRRSRDNMPYGVIRDLRDPQSDLNRRRSRALVLLTGNRVMYEKGAINDPAKFYDEINRPDGMAEVEQGAITTTRIQIVKDQALAASHVELARDDERFIQSISGVTDENLGKKTNAISGKAIEARQLQGHTTSGVPFDNYYYGCQLGGEILLSNIEQFKDQEEEFRITDEQQTDEFVTINEAGEDGQIKNSIIAQKADYVVGKQDFRETLRLAMFETLSELLQSLARSGMGQVALSLLDLVVDYMDDLPGKRDIVARIRKINGQFPPEDEMAPEERENIKLAEEASGKEAAAMKQLQMAMAQVKLANEQADVTAKQARASKDQVDAVMKKLDGFLKAMSAAAQVAGNPALTAAADTLIAEAEKSGVRSSEQSQGTPEPSLGSNGPGVNPL